MSKYDPDILSEHQAPTKVTSPDGADMKQDPKDRAAVKLVNKLLTKVNYLEK